MGKNRTMIMTPGWIRAWPNIMKALGRDDLILLLEPGISPLADEEILSFFDLTQVSIGVEPLDLRPFKCVLRNLLA